VEDTGGRMFGLEEREVVTRRQYVNHARTEIEVRSSFSFRVSPCCFTAADDIFLCSLIVRVVVEGQNMRFELLPRDVSLPSF
jgi:hypothetical protein